MSLNLWNRVVGNQRPPDLMRLAQEVAVGASPIVRRAVLAGTLPIDRAEARGYVRAKATPTIRPRVEIAARAAALVASDHDLLLAEATERTVRLVLDELLRTRSRQVPMRRAA